MEKEKNIRRITRLGGSSAITLPIAVIRKLKWRINQKVRVRVQGEKIVVEDTKKADKK